LHYKPFGEKRSEWNAYFSPNKFTGQREEYALGSLYHYGARFYSPTLGRFLSADTIVPGAGNPQALNRYSMVLNNPLRYTDPTGHCPAPPSGSGRSICFALFIQSPTVVVNENDPILHWRIAGDGRSYSSSSAETASRGYVQILNSLRLKEGLSQQGEIVHHRRKTYQSNHL
jgi:RHS repeat-associated protein